MKNYVLLADVYSGVYFDEDNFAKAKKSNSDYKFGSFYPLSFCTLNKIESLLSEFSETKKFYAIKNGRIKGIVTNWSDCEKLVSGFAGAKYKSFNSLSEAVAYYLDKTTVTINKASSSLTLTNTSHSETVGSFPSCYAFVDGSFNPHKKKYGYGVVLIANNKNYEFSGSDNNPQKLLMRNVSGEIDGAMRAISEAIKLKLPEITIYYDYEGIKKWATGEWARNKKGTIEYYDFISDAKNHIQINFVKVKAHSGVELNERVDQMAKKAVGLI